MPSVLLYEKGSGRSGEHGLGYDDRPIRISDFSELVFAASDGEEAGSAVAIHSGTGDVP